jgi:TldD protein
VPDLDASFAVLPLDTLADAALGRARSLGATSAELRVERLRTQVVVVRDGLVETTVDSTELGLGLRVLHGGALGFAGTVALSPEAAAALADEAVSLARSTVGADGGIELADEAVYGDVHWVAPYEVDPTAVPLADKVATLTRWTEQLRRAHGVDHAVAHVLVVAEDTHLADLAGNRITQRRVRVHPVVEAVAVDTASGSFETMRSLAAPAGRGWEHVEGPASTLDAEVAALPDLLAEKVAAPSVEPGTYDLVLDPTNLWLTIHESVGHATELDRALGYEASYAGTSFATLEQLGSLRYGSPLMHVTGDRTEPHGLATVAYDHEGVAAQSFDLVRDGTLVGFQLDRRMAAEHGFGRSNGCAFADSPLHVPIQRMANVSLQPAPGDGPTVEELVSDIGRGLYVVGDKSWSIDMQRHNFQFTGQRFYRIERGRLAGQVRDAAYQATTTDFWASLDGLGGRSTWVLGGAVNCGKGQPGQVAPVSHGCPAARFRQVTVLNSRAEAGR